MKLKNILTFAMSLALVVPVMTTNNISTVNNPITVSANGGYGNDDYDYVKNNDYITNDGYIYTFSEEDNTTLTVINAYPEIDKTNENTWWYTSNIVDLIIPSKINNMPVTNISGFNGELLEEKIERNGKIIYNNNLGIKYPYVETIQIPESVKYISGNSFKSGIFSVYDEKTDSYTEPQLKEVTILSKDVEIGDGFLCSWSNEPMTDVTLIGYVGSTTEEYAKKYGFNFVDITTIQKDDDTSKDNDTNKDNTKNPTIGDSKKNTIGDSGKTNDTGKTNNSTTDKTSSTTVKTSSPATSDNGVMPLIGLGAIVGVGALLSKKKIG